MLPADTMGKGQPRTPAVAEVTAGLYENRRAYLATQQ
jgi:hypothetical protein